jgi:hypothetical protein
MIDKNLSNQELEVILLLCKRNFTKVPLRIQESISKGFWAEEKENGLIHCFACNKTVKTNTRAVYAAAFHAREHFAHIKAFV